MSIGEVTESMLFDAWSTGAAFQCAHNQPVIDCFIAGYRGSLDKPFRLYLGNQRPNPLLLHQRLLIH